MDFSVGSEMAEALSVKRVKPSEPDHSTQSLNKYVVIESMYQQLLSRDLNGEPILQFLMSRLLGVQLRPNRR